MAASSTLTGGAGRSVSERIVKSPGAGVELERCVREWPGTACDDRHNF
jgi:hypothetical protein